MPHNQQPDIDWTALTKALAQPFNPSDIKYRPGAINRDKTKAQALPYADPRTYEDRLNTLLPGNWHVDFQPWGDTRIICRLTIHTTTRSSTGESNDGPNAIAGTSAEAQAFKRACTKFGLGRYLYATHPQWTPYNAETKRLTREPDQVGAPSQEQPPADTNGIGANRAASMHRVLSDAGLPRQEHEAFASSVLRRAVGDLAHLSEVEARLVWETVAKRQSSS